MATRLKASASGNIKAQRATWSGMTQATGDVGDAMNVEGALAIAVSILSGVLGAGGTITWQGSFDGVTWFTLTSDIGAPAALTQAAVGLVTMAKERPAFIRPFVSAGDGATNLVCIANATYA